MAVELWLSTREFADTAGVTLQVARRILKRSLAGAGWRNSHLQVRLAGGRGGRRGVGYQVALASMPPEITSDLEPVATLASELRTSSAAEQGPTITQRWPAVSKVVAHAAGSKERVSALAAAAAEVKMSPRTLRRWVAAYEAQGLAGLGRARKSDTGQARIQISRPFDTAFRQAGYPEALLSELSERNDATLKSLWASRAERAGSREIGRLATFLLREECERRHIELPGDAFRLSRRRVERFASFRVVNQRRNDRKAFDDAKPRIRRDWTMLDPMERVVADVKHLDVIVRREDGSAAWPKIVAFQDAGTGRMFAHPVVLPKGEGVRQEHVIAAFLEMVCEPGWGFPRGLYLDNGAEFAALVKLEAALAGLSDAGSRTIIFAQPYNASAKPIESAFARLDRYVCSMLPGYAGPNRMAQKTQTVGRPPAPFPGDWDEFTDALKTLIAEHNSRPVGGLWGGRSPTEWFDDKAAAGWRPTTVDPDALDAAFCDHASRRETRKRPQPGRREAAARWGPSREWMRGGELGSAEVARGLTAGPGTFRNVRFQADRRLNVRRNRPKSTQIIPVKSPPGPPKARGEKDILFGQRTTN
jgi:hypothetical protein